MEQLIKITNMKSFESALDTLGFDTFWQYFMKSYLSTTRPDLADCDIPMKIDLSNNIFDFDNLGDLYEIALAHTNKINKKELGQYYTPKDVSDCMAKKLLSTFDINKNVLADVCCGTGNLIISVLSQLNTDIVYDLFNQKKIYLYDIDSVALDMAVMKIAVKFIKKDDKDTYENIKKYIKCCYGNFLSDNIELPSNAFVISNPPYGKIPQKTVFWLSCKTFTTGDLYSVFIEKIATQAHTAVIISPQSFLGCEKFSILREVLSMNMGGVVYVFDNVPASIFSGKKKGIFNSNTANSVRAAITYMSKSLPKGFQTTPMIRFKNTERKFMFENLDSLVSNTVYKNSKPWLKIPKPLENFVDKLNDSNITVKDLITDSETEFVLYVPTTPRYFVSCSSCYLNRQGFMEIYAKDKRSFDLLYLLINSSLSYLWWRMFDGGITLKKTTLLETPVPHVVSDITSMVQEGIKLQSECMTIKVNSGKQNENIKFPDEYRKHINSIFLSTLQSNDLSDTLYSIHSNNLADVIPQWL